MTRTVFVLSTALLLIACVGRTVPYKTEEVVFRSGECKIVGDLKLPEGEGPFPVILFVHGDGPNSRTSGVTYPPIMVRMLRAGYATFAWDKPGTGESTGRIDRSHLQEQRTRIVLDAIAAVKKHPGINTGRIGLWGISQAGYVMPRVAVQSEDVKFMIAVSCPGEPGCEQGAYLFTAQAVHHGLPRADAERVEFILGAVELAQTYEEYARLKSHLAEFPALEKMSMFGFSVAVSPREKWHPPTPGGEYFWDPMDAVKKITFPVLAFFGEKDTQADPVQGAEAYRAALGQGGNPHSRVVLIPGVDHNLIISKTGSLEERQKRSRRGWTDYAPEYLDILEEWLRELPR